MSDPNLWSDATLTGSSVTEILKRFPNLPTNVLIALAVVTMLDRTVTPFRLCECGCGEPVHGKARLDSPACRKRVQRQRDAERAGSPKQFNLVLQSEIPVTIPIVPVPKVSTAPTVPIWGQTRYLVEIENPDGPGWYPEVVCDSQADAEAEAKRRLRDMKFIKYRVVPKLPPPASKLELIRDLMSLGRNDWQICSATGLSDHMVRAYMRHVEATPPQ